MPKLALTDIAIRNLAAPQHGQQDVWDANFPAFGVRVSQGGSKTFILNIHKSRRTIGRYGIVSLAEARSTAKRLLAEKTLGKARPQAITYADALGTFLEEKRKTRRSNTYRTLKGRLELHFRFHGQLAAFSHHELARQLRKIPSLTEQDHALAVAKTFFAWCHNRRLIDDNPTRGLSAHGHTSRSRVLSDPELQLIWQACEQLGCGERHDRGRYIEPEGSADDASNRDAAHHLPAHFSTIVRLLLLTGQRRGEISAIRPSYLDLERKIICLPKDLTKNGREHTFPISALTADALSKAAEGVPTTVFIFPARGNADAPFSGWSKSKSLLDQLSTVHDWTLHDLRRTFATRLAAFTPPHIVERLLNHVSGTISGVAAIYNRHLYEAECRAAVDEWERRLLKIVSNHE